jgi:hypothetical protein
LLLVKRYQTDICLSIVYSLCPPLFPFKRGGERGGLNKYIILPNWACLPPPPHFVISVVKAGGSSQNTKPFYSPPITLKHIFLFLYGLLLLSFILRLTVLLLIFKALAASRELRYSVVLFFFYSRLSNSRSRNNFYCKSGSWMLCSFRLVCFHKLLSLVSPHIIRIVD